DELQDSKFKKFNRRQEGMAWKRPDITFSRPQVGCENEPTAHVCILGFSASSAEKEVRNLCLPFGNIVSIQREAKDRGMCFVSFEDVASAAAARVELDGKHILQLGRAVQAKFVRPLPDSGPSEQLECVSKTNHVEVPGLTLVEDFVTEEEEQTLLRPLLLEAAPWTGPLKRRVQHYGRVFDYHTRHVDFKTKAPELPPFLAFVLARMEENGLAPKSPDQLTLNEYRPGQGISSHVDTHSAFTDGLASLSLGSGCVMDFKHPNGVRRRSLYLPRRSLVVMEGEARYVWSHSIPMRKTDKLGGVITRRSTRISLTFRRVRDPGAGPCGCPFEPSCDRAKPVPTATFIK
ncbi:unnamed protein product, partial [Discosporangium mesarthrocarpum]